MLGGAQGQCQGSVQNAQTYAHELLVGLSIRVPVLAAPKHRHAVAHQRASPAGLSHPVGPLAALASIHPLLKMTGPLNAMEKQ